MTIWLVPILFITIIGAVIIAFAPVFLVELLELKPDLLYHYRTLIFPYSKQSHLKPGKQNH